jgi:hypothetical protein
MNKNFESEIAEKQNISDNALNTTNKTVVGAINECKGYADALGTRFKVSGVKSVEFGRVGDTAQIIFKISNTVWYRWHTNNTYFTFAKTTDGGSTWTNIVVK